MTITFILHSSYEFQSSGNLSLANRYSIVSQVKRMADMGKVRVRNTRCYHL